MCERELETEQNCNILTLTLLAITAFLSRSPGLSSPSYMIVQHPLLLVGVTIALIQPIHGQGYNSDIPRPDAPVIYVGAFPILIAREGRRSIYNNHPPLIFQNFTCEIFLHVRLHHPHTHFTNDS